MLKIQSLFEYVLLFLTLRFINTRKAKFFVNTAGRDLSVAGDAHARYCVSCRRPLLNVGSIPAKLTCRLNRRRSRPRLFAMDFT